MALDNKSFSSSHASSPVFPSIVCRICGEDDDYANLCSPCKCRGTCAFIHEDCLNAWVLRGGSLQCEICVSRYEKEPRRLKPISQWTLPWNVNINREDRMSLLKTFRFSAETSVIFLVLSSLMNGHLPSLYKVVFDVCTRFVSSLLFGLLLLVPVVYRQWMSENTVVKWKCNAKNPIYN